MIRHILLATDGSFTAERAGDYAASIAIRFHAKVTVLHAFVHLQIPMASSSALDVDPNSNQKDAERLTEKTAERLRNQGVAQVETEMISGQPTHVFLGVAETVKPDMIILGARGLSTWQGLQLGSVSISVMQRAEIPVLVVE